MKSLISFILISLLFVPMVSAAIVSGEMNTRRSYTSTNSNIILPTIQKKQLIKYYAGNKGTCFSLVKNKKTGKYNKNYVAKKYCSK